MFIVSSLVEAARVCAGLRLITLEDYGNNRLRPITAEWVGGRAADSYHRVAVGDSSHSHMTGDTLVHTAAGQRTAQRFLSPNQDENDGPICFKSTNYPVSHVKCDCFPSEGH